MRKLKSELIKELTNLLSPLQARYTTPQINVRLMRITVNEIIRKYCYGRYIVNKKI